MRRQSTQSLENTHQSLNKRKNKTCLLTSNQIFRNKLLKSNNLNNMQQISPPKMFQKNCHISQYIVNQFINNFLMGQCYKQLQKLQLQKIVCQTMQHCSSLLNHQNWQINPSGPFVQIKEQLALKLDQQPKIKLFDPKLGFNKEKVYKESTILTQSSISLSKTKNSNFYKQRKISSFKNPFENHKNSFNNRQSFETDRKSIKSINSTSQKKTSKISNLSNLIPLRLQASTTPDIMTKRSLQDFLRQKKLNSQLGANNNNGKYAFSDKQYLKTIHQFQKTNTFLKFPKNELTQNNNQFKLPFFTARQQCALDYDGDRITLRKSSKLKKTQQILKTQYKINNSMNQNNKSNKTKSHAKKQHIKLKPLDIRKQSINFKELSSRIHTQSIDIKQQVEQYLKTNRIRFKQLDENQGKFQWIEEGKVKQKLINEQKIIANKSVSDSKNLKKSFKQIQKENFAFK